MIQVKPVLFFFCFLTLSGCTKASGNNNEGTSLIKIAFVGNSHTYLNDIPSMIKEIGKHDNKKIETTSFTKPDYSLEDHWNEGEVEKEIQKNKYHFLVAQQGSSALPESQRLLKEFAKKFADVCAATNTKMNLYMVWPMQSRLFDLDNVIYSYTEAAKYTGSSLSAAGLAWKKVWEQNPGFTLYDTDGFHASKKGSILAALIIYTSLFEKKELNFLQKKKMTWANDLSDLEFELFKEVVSKINNP
jgi:hypothetical protein